MEKPVFFVMIAAVAAAGGVAMLLLNPLLRSAFDEGRVDDLKQD